MNSWKGSRSGCSVPAVARDPLGSWRTRLEMFERMTRAQRVVLRPSGVGGGRGLPPSERRLPRVSSRRDCPTLCRVRREPAPASAVRPSDRRRPQSPGPAERKSSPLPDCEALRTLDVAAVPTRIHLRSPVGREWRDEERLTKVVERLVEPGAAVRAPRGAAEFPQDRLREEAYSHLTDNRRRLIHRRVGETREAMGSGDLSRVFSVSPGTCSLGRGPKSIEYNHAAESQKARRRRRAPGLSPHAARKPTRPGPGDRGGNRDSSSSWRA